MEAQRHLYVVFSATPYRMGKFLRLVMRGTYNHVSISPFVDLSELYSFARYYRNTPFWGGFVKESSARYIHHDQTAAVRICAIPVSEEQYHLAEARLAAMKKQMSKYSYNLPSALCVPIHHRVQLHNSFTCVEFVTDFLLHCHVGEIEENRFYTLPDLEKCLSPYTVYEGSFPDAAANTEDPFNRRQPFWTATRNTLSQNGRLFYRIVRK